MKTFVKGGAWKNIEDEILKTAVMKYGKNNWPIIASLLPRKSAKQCKARWYDWLDPEIKKVEWTRDEDEKLLHLAKIFPTQWRTIAPAVGRTAAQCLDRYEQLLDEAQEKDGKENDQNSILNLRRLRPGEIDPNPESKPARPDAIDMDEDELEMLSEAKARLSNTMGKKEKRKAREAAMDEERRLAAIQRTREMKSAGIYSATSSIYSSKISNARKKKHFSKLDVNKEIPFFHRPQPGLYDTTHETPKNDSVIFGSTIEEIEGKRQMDVEREKRKEDKRKQALRKKLNLPEHFKRLSRMHEETKVLDKREKLVLPSPQVSDSDLENIGKLSNKLDENVGTISSSGLSSQLLGDYKSTPIHRNAHYSAQHVNDTSLSRTDRLKAQARDLLALTQTQTPLAGGQQTPFHESFNDFHGVTPFKVSHPSQNPLTSPLLVLPSGITSTPFQGVQLTPSSVTSSTPTTNIHRDQLGINTYQGGDDDRTYYESILRELKYSLSNLPQPSEASKILRVYMKEEEDMSPRMNIEKDAFENDMEKLNIEEDLQSKFQPKTSLSFRKELPTPKNLNQDSIHLLLKNENANNITKDNDFLRLLDESRRLIANEIQSLVRFDNCIKAKESAKSLKQKFENWLNTPKSYIEFADKILHEEYSQNPTLSSSDFRILWEKLFNSLQEERGELNSVNALNKKYSIEVGKLLNSCLKYQNGYTHRENNLLTSIRQSILKLKELSMEKVSIQHLNDIELISEPNKLKALQETVQIQREKNRSLQEEFTILQLEVQAHFKSFSTVST